MPIGNPSLRAMIDPRAQFGQMGRDSAATAGIGIPQGQMGGPLQAGPGLEGVQPTPPTPAEMQAGGGPMGMIGQGMPMGMDPGMLQLLMILSDPAQLQQLLAQASPEEQQLIMQLAGMLSPAGMAGPAVGPEVGPAVAMPGMAGQLPMGGGPQVGV